MKWLRKMRLINWHYFHDETLEFGRQTLITGKNGAGKSTIIDAMQVLFVADQRHIRFNPAAHDEAKRTLIHYLKGKVGNDERTFVRDGDFTSYLMCEFLDDSKGESFVIGVVIDVYRDNAYEEEYFILADQKLDDIDVQQPSGQLRDREAFRRLYHQGGRKRSVFERNKSNYQKALMTRFGQLHERFFSIFTKALSFKPIDNIRHFVYDYILDERELQLDVMRENFEIHERYQRELEEMEVRRDHLRQIRDTFNQFARYRETVRQQDYVVRRLTYMDWTEKVEQTRAKLFSLTETVAELDRKITLAEQKKEEAGKEKERAFQAWQSHQAEMRKRELEKELALMKDEEQRLQEELTVLIKQIDAELRLLERMCSTKEHLPWACPDDELRRLAEDRDYMSALLSNLKHLLTAMQARPEVDSAWAELSPLSPEFESVRLDEIGMRLSQQYERMMKKISRLEDQIEQLQGDIKELDDVISRLEKKQRTYPDGVQRLKRLLEEKLGSRSPVWIFCEEMEIKDEDWRNALEGYLNTQRFDLLVKPEVFAEALHVYEQEKWRHQLEGVGLVDTEKEQRYLGTAKQHSLAEELTTENEVIRAHIEHLLGRVMKAKDEHELRLHRTAVTRSCMVYQRLVARQMRAERYAVPYIGSKAIARQLQIKRAERKQKQQALEDLQRELRALHQWSDPLQEKRSAYQRLADHMDIPSRWEACRTKHKTLEDELAKIDLTEALKLKAVYEEWRDKEREWSREHLSAVEKRAQEDNERKHVAAKLSELETQAEEARQHWHAWRESFGEEAEQKAIVRFREAEKQNLPVAQKIRNWENNWKGNQTRRDEHFQALIKLRQQYNMHYHFSAELETEENTAYDKLLHEIEHINIPQYQEKVKAALAESEEEFKSHFIYKLKEAIELAKREFNELNHALRHFPFSDDRYHFEVRPSEKYKRFYDVIMDPNLIERGSLFDVPDEGRSAVLQELFEVLVRGEAGDLDEFTDYRRYLDFDIQVTSGGERYRFSQVLREKSGGETQTPFYIAILASFHHLYQSSNAIRLVVFDEAFNKMDEQRIQTSLRLIKQMNLQLIAAVPDEKMQHMVPEVTTTLIVSNRDYRCFVDLLDVQQWADEDLDIPAEERKISV